MPQFRTGGASARVAVIAGDGIGLEVTPAAIRTIDHALARHGASIEWNHLDWGSDYYRSHGRMMPENGIEILGEHDAIFLGAVGAPDIDDTVTLWGLLIPIRRQFEQYINLRPVRSFAGIPSPVRGGDDLDLLIVRENNEGEYSEVGGRLYRGQPSEMAVQENIFTRRGIERVTRFASDLANQRNRKLTSATKSNGIIHTMPFWDQVVAEVVSKEYPDVQLESVLIDALAARMVLRPNSFDVMVCSNLFGDIMSDLAAAVAGSIGVAPSANLNPEGNYPSLFEPVHGSAPDIAGRGIANPVGAIWAGVMMLEHLGYQEAADEIFAAIQSTLAGGTATGDLGGTATTEAFTDAVIAALG